MYKRQLLVHLGYLTYDSLEESVRIPNKEVSQEYVNAISTMNWHEVIDSVEASRKLLEALWNLDGEAVARGIDKAHREISILQYNDENSLSCTISLAFYFAREYYTIVRELPAGKGFADLCFIPRMLHSDKPAVVIELKWDKNVKGAISQIKEKQYIEAVSYTHLDVYKRQVLGSLEREEGTPAYEVLETYVGKDLEYKEYEPLYNFKKLDKKAHYVVCDTYVTLTCLLYTSRCV